MQAISEHQAQLQIEEWQAQPETIIIQTATSVVATLAVSMNGINYIVATRVRIDLRLIDLVRQMQEKLADAATIDKSPARE